MADLEVDTLVLSVGSDLPWLIGYEAMPLERLTMLVVSADGASTLVIPELEVPRVGAPDTVALRPWSETEDPIAIVASLVGDGYRIAIGPHTWSRFLLQLQDACAGAVFLDATTVTGPLRAVKDATEIDALARAATAIDEVVIAMRDRPFAGRTEADVAREIADRILEVGHARVNFTIVAAGPNSASPHHEPTTRVIEVGDPVLVDIGGTFDGYCSDITRMFSVGPARTDMVDAYGVLVEAQAVAVAAGTVGTACEMVDVAARQIITDAGYGDYFVHRTGHGIGTEAHEDPYMVFGNDTPIEAGHAYSVEPGIYVPDAFGIRLEDIVIATISGPQRLNQAPRDIAIVH